MPQKTPVAIAIFTLILGLFLHNISPLPAFAEESSASPCPATAEPIPETPQPSQGNTQETLKIRFSSLFPDPAGDDAAAEYMSLKNMGSLGVNLTGWTVQNAAGKTYALEVTLGAQDTLVLPYTLSKIPLTNTGGTLTLFDHTGNSTDTVTYGPAKTGQTYDRDTNDEWSWNGTPSSSPTPAPTPAVTEQPTKLPLIRLLRFLPDPAGSDDAEWIELQNTESTAVTLEGWRIDDQEGGSAPYRIPTTTIEPLGTLRIAREESGIALNNDGDQVRLLAPDGSIVDTASYGTSPEDGVYEWTATGWSWPSPAPTTLIEPPPPQEPIEEPETPPNTLSVSLAELDALEVGTELHINGVVTMPPGIVGKSIFALQDENGLGGVFVQIFGTNTHELHVGDVVVMQGSLRTRTGRPYIATTAVKMSLGAHTQTTPLALTVDEVAREHEGMLVTLQGTLTKRTSLTATLADDSLQTEISAEIPRDSLRSAEPGTTVRMTGVLRRNGEGYELFASKVNEITDIAPPEPQPDTPTTPNTEAPKESETLDTTQQEEGGAAKSGFSWAALAAAGSTAAAVLFGKKRPPLA